MKSELISTVHGLQLKLLDWWVQNVVDGLQESEVLLEGGRVRWGS